MMWGIPPDILKAIANTSKKRVSFASTQANFLSRYFIYTYHTYACMFCSFEGGPWSIVLKYDIQNQELVQGKMCEVYLLGSLYKQLPMHYFT